MNPQVPNQPGPAPQNGVPMPQAPAPTPAQPVVTPGQPAIQAPGQPAAQPTGAAPHPMITQQMQPTMHPGQQGNPTPASNPNSTQNTLQIAEIRDGIVIMNDGSFRSVVLTKSINFDLMSRGEQEAVEYSFQSFLNSLYFPIQIFVRSAKIDLQPYIEKLDKIRTEHDNMLLALLMDDYIGYIDALSQQTNIMDKKFYVVIPYFPHVETSKLAVAESKNFFSGLAGLFKNTETKVVINEADLETAKSELRNRVQAVLSGLLQCGVQGLPLDTQELIELYYDTYNPDTAINQPLQPIDTLTADVITKGEGFAQQPHLNRELQ